MKPWETPEYLPGAPALKVDKLVHRAIRAYAKAKGISIWRLTQVALTYGIGDDPARYADRLAEGHQRSLQEVMHERD